MSGLNLSSLLIFAVVVTVTILAVAAVVSGHRTRKLNLFWAIVCVVLCSAALLLCLVGASAGTLVAKPSGDPQRTVISFFEALIGGDYPTAYAQLEDYGSLGLENEPATEVGRLVYAALRDSYSYDLHGDCTVEKLYARQPIVFEYLKLPDIEADVKSRTAEILKQFVDSRPRSELYDQNNQYLPSVTEEAYLLAVTEVLANAEDYYETLQLNMELDYRGGRWQLRSNPALLSAIAGGAA